MALKDITIAGFGPFEYEDTDPDTPFAITTNGNVELEGLKTVQLEAENLVAALKVKPGGSIFNDNDTFQLTDTGFKLVDTTGQFEAEFFSASFNISDLINAYRTRVNSFTIKVEPIPATGATEFGVDDTLGFSFISFPGTSAVFRFLGGQYKFYDTTDATSATTGSVQTLGGIGVAKNVYAGADVRVGRNIHVHGITNVTSLPFGAANEGLYYRVDDTGLSGDPITIPAATGSGRIIVIKDIIGTFDSAPITLSSASSTIDGSASFVLNKFRQCITLIDAASGEWDIINDVGF